MNHYFKQIGFTFTGSAGNQHIMELRFFITQSERDRFKTHLA